MSLESEDDIEWYRNITSTSTTLYNCCLYYRHNAFTRCLIYSLLGSSIDSFWCHGCLAKMVEKTHFSDDCNNHATHVTGTHVMKSCFKTLYTNHSDTQGNTLHCDAMSRKELQRNAMFSKSTVLCWKLFTSPIGPRKKGEFQRPHYSLTSHEYWRTFPNHCYCSIGSLCQSFQLS